MTCAGNEPVEFLAMVIPDSMCRIPRIKKGINAPCWLTVM